MLRLPSHFFVLLTSFATSAALAQEKSDPGAVATPIPDLVRQLDADQFAVREFAARDLKLAGADAVPYLFEAATTGNAEVQRRSLEILRKISSEAGDQTVAALEKIESSGSPGSVEIARSLLRLTRAAKSGEIPVEEFVIPGATIESDGDTMRIRLAGGGMIQTKLAGGGGSSRSVIKNGGNTFILGSTGGKQVIIVSGAEGDIKMKVTADEDGTPVTRAYQFIDAGNLREMDPDLFELYSRLESGDGVKKLFLRRP